MKHVEISRDGPISVDRGKAANPISYEIMRELTDAARSFENDFET